jgi:tripartite-type tricarboxylate transporter receptor subunit TctC
VSSSTIVLVADPKLGFRNVQDMVAYAKANPGKLTFGSTGTGGSLHLGGEMFKLMAGVDMTHVPYKGAAQALTDIMGNHLSFIFVSMAAVLPLAKSGKIQPLAVASLKRNPSLPDLPTMDSIYPGFEVTASNGVVAPARTPAAVITRINQAMAKALATPFVRDAFAKSGVEPVISTPEEFGASIRNEVARWGKVVKAINFVQAE